MVIDFIWNDVLINPMINALIILSNVLFNNYGLALIAFTILTRGATYPLTLRQLRTTRAMQQMQPRMREIQKKHKDPKRRQQEMMKLYREVGFNPLGCAIPFLIQIPILIALFQVIRQTLGSTPEALLGLSARLYDWDFITEAVPLSREFLTMDLSANGTLPLGIIVGISTFYQQKFSTTRSTAPDDRQATTNRTLLWMMPLMFAIFTTQWPSGLGLYWVAQSIAGIAIAYLYNRPRGLTWGWLVNLEGLPAPALPTTTTPAGDVGQPARASETASAAESEAASATAEGGSSGKRRRRRRRRRRRAGGTN